MNNLKYLKYKPVSEDKQNQDCKFGVKKREKSKEQRKKTTNL